MNFIATVIAQHINNRQQQKNVKNKFRLDTVQRQQNQLYQQQEQQEHQEQQAHQRHQQNGQQQQELQQQLQHQNQQLRQQPQQEDVHKQLFNQLDNQEENKCMTIVEENESKQTTTKRTFSVPVLFSLRSRSNNNMKHASKTMISTKTKRNYNCSFDNNDMIEEKEPFLYKLAKSWAWSAVIHRCKTHPDEVKFARDHENGDNILHWCTFGNASVDVVNAVLNVHYDAINEKNYFTNNLPIHVACSYRSSNQVIKVLIEAYPESVGISNINGSYPIHILCDSDGSLSVFYTILSNLYVVPTLCMIDNVHYQYPLNILYSRHNKTNSYDFHNRLKNLRLLRQQQMIIKTKMESNNGRK